MKYKYFVDPIYGANVLVVYFDKTELEPLTKLINKELSTNFDTIPDTYEAVCCDNENGSYALAFRAEDSIPNLISSISHETNHLMSAIFERAGVPLHTNKGLQENQCYFQGFLAKKTSEILEKFGAFSS